MNTFLYRCLPGLMLLTLRLYSQDTVSLKEIDVTAGKSAFSSHGKKVQELDSAQKQQFVFASIGELLSMNSPVFIKSYGPGALSTSAFRGGSASHTGVLWNGFNIQNAMLGQTDLSLLPTILFDDISVEYGGSSALWGSGAVAGSIHLKNAAKFNRGLTTKANIGGGSFGMFNASAAIEQSKERLISSTKFYLQNSANTFLFRDTLDKNNSIKEQRHAAFSFRGLMQEFKILKGSNHLFSLSGWYNEGLREIPVFSNFTVSRPVQKDLNIKAAADWKYAVFKLKSMTRAAVFYDELHYSDPGFEVTANSFLNTFIIENENFYQRTADHTLNLAGNFTLNSAVTKNYSGKKMLHKTALAAGSKWNFLRDKLVFLTNLRVEYFSVASVPVTGNAALEFWPKKNISMKLNGAKVYRQPTLNELYWNPGGNKDLLPEQGYTSEGDIAWTLKKNKLIFKVSGSAFYRVIDNWILWLPANNMSTPVNVQKVFSRGTETHWGLNYRKGKIYCALNVISSYVLSTVSESSQEFGNSVGRQLIYTPRYAFNSNMTLAYSGVSLSLYHQYTGYRFTSSDNLQWLPPYHLLNARLSWSTKINATHLILFAACNNITDNTYAIVTGRPMPLRSFEFGISLNHHKPKNISPEN